MLVTMNPTRGMNAAIPFPPGTTTKYWAFARGGAWRNPKPTGGPYVCEQCRLDACGGNDATFTLQAVTTIELAPADVCADCGARLLEELLDARLTATRSGGHEWNTKQYKDIY